MKRFFGRIDLLLILGILAAALLLFLLGRGKSEALTAVIRCDGEIVYEIPLHTAKDTQQITLDNGITVEICGDGARILSSPCRDKTCVHCGKLTKSGETAVCLPCRTQLLLTGGDTAKQLDALSY